MEYLKETKFYWLKYLNYNFKGHNLYYNLWNYNLDILGYTENKLWNDISIKVIMI